MRSPEHKFNYYYADLLGNSRSSSTSSNIRLVVASQCCSAGRGKGVGKASISNHFPLLHFLPSIRWRQAEDLTTLPTPACKQLNHGPLPEAASVATTRIATLSWRRRCCSLGFLQGFLSACACVRGYSEAGGLRSGGLVSLLRRGKWWVGDSNRLWGKARSQRIPLRNPRERVWWSPTGRRVIRLLSVCASRWSVGCEEISFWITSQRQNQSATSKAILVETYVSIVKGFNHVA